MKAINLLIIKKFNKYKKINKNHYKNKKKN